MRELLPDNVALAERLEALPSTAASNHAPLREVASITSWTCAFATYIAVVAQAHPARVCDMLAYMRLILREAQKYKEGMGWLTYDSVFRQNNQGTARWDTLYPSLHMAFIGCQGVPATPPCCHCRGVDHIAANCALSPLTPPVHPGNVQQSAASTGDRKMRQIQQRQIGGFICRSWNWG